MDCQNAASSPLLLFTLLCHHVFTVHGEGPSSITRRSGISPVLPGLEEEEEKGLRSHGGKHCSLQNLDLDTNANIKRSGRGKKASIKYKRKLREENKTWWLPLSWLYRGVDYLREKYPSKGLAQVLSPCTECLTSSWEPPGTSSIRVKLPSCLMMTPHSAYCTWTRGVLISLETISQAGKILFKKKKKKRASTIKIKLSAA